MERADSGDTAVNINCGNPVVYYGELDALPHVYIDGSYLPALTIFS